MGKINKVNKQTTNPYLNLYDLDVVNKVGREGHYYVASRAKTEDDLKLSSIENNDPDGVRHLQSLRRKERQGSTDPTVPLSAGWLCV